MTSTVNGFGAVSPGAAVAGAGQAGHLGTEAARREHGRLGEGRYRGPGALAEARRALRVALPEPSSRFSQDDEWCVVAQPDGSWSEFRFHDYHRIFDVPGLYEKIFYDVLGCDTPRFMADLFADALAASRVEAGDVRVLDLGAGNGIMAEELTTVGVPHAVGVDILPEARAAAERDRPGLYADYLVADLTALDAADSRRLHDQRLNALTVVAALGFGDIPPAAFRTAYDHVDDGGWVVLTIKDAFLAEDDTSGFATMIADGMASGALEVVRRERFRHRLATDASPLVYEGIVARKRGPLA